MTRSRYCQAGIAALIMLALLPGCGGTKAEAEKTRQDKGALPVPVSVEEVKTREVQRALVFVGTLEAKEEVVVGSQLEAPVSKVYVDMGDRVEKGGVLVKLDDEAFRIRLGLAQAALNEALARLGVEDEKDLVVEKVSSVRKARAELDDSERNYKRTKELEAKGFVSKSQLDAAQSAYDVASADFASQVEYGRSLCATVKSRRAEVELAQKQLRDTDVRAPISGFVSKKCTDAGCFVKVGGELIRMVSVDPLRLRGDVPEANAREIRLGQEVRVKLSAVPGREYTGRISRISPASSPESRSFTIEALIPNGRAGLKPGYFAEASVGTGVDEDATVVPLNSLVNFAGVTKVFVVAGGKAVEKPVTPGIRVGDVIEVKGDIKAGDQVVTSGMKRLYDGKTVVVR